MKYRDIKVFKEDRYSIGQEVESGTYCITISVFNGYLEYDEYYRMTDAEFHELSADSEKLGILAKMCREGKNTGRLMNS